MVLHMIGEHEMRNCAVHGGGLEEYCEAHGYRVKLVYQGRVEEYNGLPPVLVTREQMTLFHYHFCKYVLGKRGKVLVHATRKEKPLDDLLERFVQYLLVHERAQRPTAGRPPYGFHRVDGHLEVNEEEAEIVREIFRLRDAGMTYQQIKEELDRAGARTRTGRGFATSTIQVILGNRSIYLDTILRGVIKDEY